MDLKYMILVTENDRGKGALLKCRINSVVSDDIKCVSTTMNVDQAEKAVLDKMLAQANQNSQSVVNLLQ